MSSLACISEPISWLQLETFALGTTDAAVASHLAACPACAHCLDEIRGDLVALPPLAVPAAPTRSPWWTRLVPAMALAAATILVILLWRAEDTVEREDMVRVKGVGEVVVGTVRERDGVIRHDPRSFVAGDRWKLVITCPPAASAHVEVTVAELGSDAIDRPLAPSDIACGNRVVIPGAFRITGARANRVCVTITSAAGSEPGTACVTLKPE